MLQSVRRALAYPAVRAETIPTQALLTAAVVGGFVALLVEDRVHPVVIYLLQLYLSL